MDKKSPKPKLSKLTKTKKEIVKKPIKEIVEEYKDVKQSDISSMVSNLVKQDLEVFKNIVTPEDDLIISDIANGMLKDEVINKYQIDLDYYNNFVSNPIVAKKIKEYTLQNTYANKDITMRLNNGVIKALYNAFSQRENELMGMPLDKLLKALKDQIDIQNKLNENNKVDIKIDLTTLINENVRKDRIKEQNGEIGIKSMFPVIEEESGEIIGTWDGIDGGLNE